jgi:rhodanese-related sulfurtransferase
MLRALAALLLLVPAVACAQEPASATGAQQPTSFATVDVHELESLREAGGVVVLDVRTAAEFAAGRMPGAINLDLGELPGALDRLDAYRDQPLYVSCRTSNRSRVASALLVEAGFSDVTQVLGGFAAWSASGYPVER